MRPESPSTRLSPDEVGEVLRRSGVSGVRIEGRPTVEEVAEKAGLTPDEVQNIVRRIRSLGAAINAPSGDLERIREEAQDLEDVEEDPRALARVAADYTGVQREGGAGKLPKTTRFVLLFVIAVFLILVIITVTKAPALP